VDCDPGHDDVVAIVLAASECEVVGVTTVAGNAPLGWCTRNALATLELLELDIAVHPGADRPLLRSARHASGVHGDDGMVGVDVPAPRREPSPTGAVEWLLDVSRAVDDLWVVATGPLTNVALALRADPGFADRLAGISLMGGGITTGNVTPAAEFNFWFDPDAAAVVFESGVHLRMCGLDVTHQVLVGLDDAEAFRAGGGALGSFVAAVYTAHARSYQEILGQPRAPLHDPCAVVALTRPELFGFEHLHVAVETRGRHTAGTSVADRRGLVRGPTLDPNCHVALEVDAAGVLDLVRRAISAPATPRSR
jgi:inosine-uridine nucleoside N-ribohydrolase